MTARYEYKRAGTYRVKVAGSGKDACVGVKEATVTLGTVARADTKGRPPPTRRTATGRTR